jgi:hypothetical protein
MYLAWLRDRFELQIIGERGPAREWPSGFLRAELLRRARGRRGLRREFLRWWRERGLPDVSRRKHIPFDEWQKILSRVDLYPPWFERDRSQSVTRAQGRPSVVARASGQGHPGPLIRECVELVEEWQAHLADHPNAERHVRSLGIWTDDSPMVAGARVFDVRRRDRAARTAYRVLSALILGSNAEFHQIVRLAQQLYELGRRPVRRPGEV